MDRSVGSPRTWSVVGVRGPGVGVFRLPSHPQARGITPGILLVDVPMGGGFDIYH